MAVISFPLEAREVPRDARDRQVHVTGMDARELIGARCLAQPPGELGG